MDSDNYHLAVAELVIYVIAVIPAIVVLCLHGKKGLAGWLMLAIFFILQIVAQGLIVATGQHSVSSTGLILGQVGISPLILATDGILRESASETSLCSSFLFRQLRGWIFDAVLAGAAAMIGVGAGSLYSSDPSSSAQALVKAGAIVLLLCWLWLGYLTVILFIHHRELQYFRQLLYGSTFALPWLLVRILSTLLAFFDTSTTTFSPVHGNFTAKLIMQALTSIFVSIGFVVVGISTAKGAKTLSLKRDQRKSTNPVEA